MTDFYATAAHMIPLLALTGIIGNKEQFERRIRAGVRRRLQFGTASIYLVALGIGEGAALYGLWNGDGGNWTNWLVVGGMAMGTFFIVGYWVVDLLQI